MFELLLDPQTYVSFTSLVLLEIVLGVDNIIFISILAGKLPEADRNRARIIGLIIAVLGRLLLLSGIAWLVNLTTPFINIETSLINLHFSGKDLVMLGGGLFLIWKSAQEIYEKVEADPEGTHNKSNIQPAVISMQSIIAQIIIIDMVFSLDSIITAVGLVQHIGIMVAAILVSVGVMIASANSIGGFIDKHPSVKVLALSFLLMIGTVLVAEAFHYEIPKGYIYFSLAFSLFVEMVNIRSRKTHTA